MIPLCRTLKPALISIKVSSRTLLMVTTLGVSDAIALSLAGICSVYLRLWFDGQYSPDLYLRLWPVVGLFLLAYGAAELYPAVGISPVEELRRIVLTTTLIYLVLGAAIFLFQEGETYSRGAFLLAWILSLGSVQIGRWLVRTGLSHCSWWGYPVLILGAGKTGAMIISALKRQPGFGLKPIAVLDDDPQKLGKLHNIPVLGPISIAPQVARQRDIRYAIIAMPGVRRDHLLKILERYGYTFPHLLMIPDLFGFASLWVASRDMGGILGLEVRQQLLLPGPRWSKALLDVSMTLILGLLLLPVIAAIALLIMIDSPGPIFYGHHRLGRGASPFKAWKFRSMVVDGDQVLDEYLGQHPEQKVLWQRERKLKQDPRITRIGRFLRRTSLDELPQLWNVLRGEMSLVGPRPIVEAEIDNYAEKFELYARVLPGITGLWQVSGRNNVSYDERVSLDAYYVRNWSVWLDIHILLRTVWVVLIGDGAY